MEPPADAAPERPRIATHQLNLNPSRWNTGRWRPLTEGYGFLAPLAAATLVAARTMPLLAPVPAILGGLIALAFRDPERDIQQRASAVLSPADGRVLRVSVEFDEHWQIEMTEVAIFLALQDVHVQRIPLTGKVVAQVRKAGGYKPAMTEAATHGNNQLATYIQTDLGPCTVTQISGLVARRIVTWSQVGDHVEQGDRMGMIKFGSQVTLRLPTSMRVLVAAGDRVTGGLTVIAEV